MCGAVAAAALAPTVINASAPLTGLALLATGLTLGFVNRGSLEDVRARQVDGRCGTHHCVGELADLEDRAVLADGLWLSGAGVTAVGVGLWFWLD